MAEIDVWYDATVQAMHDITADIRMFEITPLAGFTRPSAGSHLRVQVSIGRRTDTRSYSIVGPCDDGVYRIAVKRLGNSRGGSLFMWGLVAGARVMISGPHNRFELGHGRPGYLLIAGGIGITPIYTMALALAEAGATFRVAYCCRSAADAAFAAELRARIGDRLDLYLDSIGDRLDMSAAIAALPPGGEVYVCGPIGMQDAVKQHWRSSSRPADQLRFETFGSSGHLPNEAFTIVIPRLGLTIDVPPNRTMLDVIEAAGVEMMFDCRRGECGLCALPVLQYEGIIDHRDVYFSDEEKSANQKLCTCVSRLAGTTLAVDIPCRSV